jgi:S-layer protein
MVGSAAGNFTLGVNASTAGITSVTLTDVDAADTVTIGAGFATNLTVNIAAAATALNTVSAAAYTKVLTVAAAAGSLDNTTSVLTGGTGTSDVLSIAAAAATIVTTSISAFENWTFTGTAGATSTVTMVSVDGNIASGKSLTVDFTSLDDDVLAADFSAEADGTVTILADGDADADHIITLGQGADTYTSTSLGTDTVVATKGNNTISTGDGVDIITLGTGTDTITIGTAGDADVVKVIAEASLVANTAVITDWTTSAAILLTFAIVDASSRNLVALDDGANATAANSVKTTITGAQDLGDTDTITANSTQLGLSSTTAYSTSSAVETALEYGGAFQLTNQGAKAAGDTFFVSYDDNVSTYISMVTVNSVVADGAYFGVGSLDAKQIIKLTGIADNTTVVTGDLTYA